MKKIIPIIIIIVISLDSCHNKQGNIINKERNKHRNNYKIEKIMIKEFILDDETSYMIDYFQFIDDKKETLAFINSYNNSLYFFNYTNFKFLKKIKYDKEGQNGVSKTQAFLYLNDDSIFTYSYDSQTLYLTNNNSVVLDKYKLYEEPELMSQLIYPSPYISTSTPLRKRGGQLICMGFISGETRFENKKNRPVGCFIDIENKTITHSINYPTQYTDYNWGGGFTYRMPYYDINNNDELIVSFSADHNIQVHSLKNEVTSFYAGSNKIDKIKSFSSAKDMPINEDNAWFWYMTNPSYQNIIYDKYKNQYYRIARLPKQDFTLSERGNMKPIIIIILDSNFKYIGEVELDMNIRYSLNNCFATKEGLNIQVHTNDDDKLTFYVYSFTKDEN